MARHAQPGRPIIRAGKLVREWPQKGDAVPSEAAARKPVAHDATLVTTLFSDLSLWKDEAGKRVREFPCTGRAVQPEAIRDIFSAVGVEGAALSITPSFGRSGALRIMLDADIFAQAGQRMKSLCHQHQRVQAGAVR